MSIIKRNGYRYVYLPRHPLSHRDGYVAEHRLIAYEGGLPVDRTVHVHHRNGDKLDNRLENLEVKTPSSHHREHIGTEIKNQYGIWPTRIEYPHGDYRRYLGRKVDNPRGCRCEQCRTAWADHYRKRRSAAR